MSHPLLDAAIFFIALNVALSFFGRVEVDIEGAEDGDDRLELADSRKDTSFGWLHADMRMPLPPYKDLEGACHLVGSHRGKYMWLCATAGGEGYTSCNESRDFTEYYGKTVWVCEGKSVNERRTNTT